MRKHPHIAATIGRTDRCAEHPPPEQVGTIGGVEAADAEAAEIEASGATDGGAGKYIVFEGAEGCGKSTQAARLATTLDAVLTRETGGTDIGARLRAILHDTTNAHLDDRAEALLAAADRAQHLAEVVRPALDAGRTVVSDRSVVLVARLPGLRPTARRGRHHQAQRVGHGGTLARHRHLPRHARTT